MGVTQQRLCTISLVSIAALSHLLGACASCPANTASPAPVLLSALFLAQASCVFSSATCPAGYYNPWILVLQVSQNPQGNFYYDSPYWTSNTNVLNSHYSPPYPSSSRVLCPPGGCSGPYWIEDVKLSSYNTVAFKHVRLCVTQSLCLRCMEEGGKLPPTDRCYSMSVQAGSAHQLFTGSFQRRTDLNQVSWESLFYANTAFGDAAAIPERSGHVNCMQRPGFNTICNDNNKARWGFCGNLPAQPCQPSDTEDSDFAIGIGINGQNEPYQLSAGYNQYFVYGTGHNGGNWRTFPAWLFVSPETTLPSGGVYCTSCPYAMTSPAGSMTLADCTCNAGFTGPDGGPCTACSAGKYKDQTGDAACTSCVAGKYSVATAGQTELSCYACPVNFRHMPVYMQLSC